MKLAPLLSQYLTTHKTLSLPGLGTFHAENNYDPEVDYSKKGASLLDIRFEQEKITRFDENLVTFIASETGKMKVLAASDLSSQLDGAINFLNTGKPYFFSGIGTLTKRVDGSFEFHKEKYHLPEKEKKKKAPIIEKNAVPQAYIDESSKSSKKKSGVIILVLCLLAVAATVWFYIKNSQSNERQIEEVAAEDSMKTAAPTAQKDTATAVAAPQANAAPDKYKYVLEVAQQPRASKRYNQLKTLNWPIEISSADSTNYTLYIALPAANADTTRIKDSLSALSGKKVWIQP